MSMRPAEAVSHHDIPLSHIYDSWSVQIDTLWGISQTRIWVRGLISARLLEGRPNECTFRPLLEDDKFAEDALPLGSGELFCQNFVAISPCHTRGSPEDSLCDEAPRSKLLGILRNSPKPLPSFAKATEGSPRLHPRSKLRGIRRRRIKEHNGGNPWEPDEVRKAIGRVRVAMRAPI